MMNYQRYIRPLLFAVVDYLSVLISLYLARQITLHYGNPNIAYHLSKSYIFMWIPAIFLMFNMTARLYHMRPIMETIKRSFYATIYGLATSIFLLYFVHSTMLGSRWFPCSFFLLTFLVICITRYSVWKILKVYNLLYEPVILIGAGLTAEKALRFYDGDLGYRYKVLGIIDDAPVSAILSSQYKLLGKFSEAGNIVKKTGVKTVMITAPGLSKEKLAELISDVQPYARNISFVPDLIGTQMAGLEANVLFSEGMMVLKIRNNLSRRRNRLMKRIFDLVCVLSGGLLILPIIAVISILVAIDNRGNVIFAHKRVGKDGKMFPCYKFQTMIPNAQEKLEEYLKENPEARKEWEESFKLTNDPRVTKLGAFLRKTSLDELPQLMNVIKGEMSLVGPRPIVTKEIERYGENFKEYSMVLPGITGMWQCHGRSDTTYAERVAMDTWYVRNWSIWVDIAMLLKTVKTVLWREGAY